MIKFKVKLWVSENLLIKITCFPFSEQTAKNACLEELKNTRRIPNGVQETFISEIISIKKETDKNYTVGVIIKYAYVTTVFQKDESSLKDYVLTEFLDKNRGKMVSIGTMEVLKKE